MKRKICVITGSRAEYGVLHWLMKGIQCTNDLQLQIIATGTHLSPEFGLTYKEIEKDGFDINRKVEMILSADTPSAIAKSTGLGIIAFADVFVDLKPDIVVILGDRYEVFAAAFAALVACIPIAHIGGGETTEGAFDESIRHSITKMAWWHFVAAGEYAKRVIQLGEDPKRIINVGGLGIDVIKRSRLLTKKELMGKTGIVFGKRNLLITYHPVTLERQTSKMHFQSILEVLNELDGVYLIFTMPNADTDGRIIKRMIDDYVSTHKENSVAFTLMGHTNYLSTLQFIDGVIGNSSSGISEAPAFKIGTINIGDRQKGRLKAESIIDCIPTRRSIKSAVETLYSEGFQKVLLSVKSPYGEGGVAEKIIGVLREAKLPEEIKKGFCDS
jgi:GDP/UDP-N,N'-diacetylbacillosamine 2-epimerase (hydrolysing)